ncbi:hypothetical protein [Mesorhizobium abyssinicae]|uniref:hypothetical protein n=1 Tax=Mesorhizobium abyssinicae TaxID=1209958 RepID=UPI00387DCA0D
MASMPAKASRKGDGEAVFIAAHNKCAEQQDNALVLGQFGMPMGACPPAGNSSIVLPTAWARRLVICAPGRQPEGDIAQFALRHGVEYRMRQRVDDPAGNLAIMAVSPCAIGGKDLEQ